jgi:M6 family metalloprotease-like protein
MFSQTPEEDQVRGLSNRLLELHGQGRANNAAALKPQVLQLVERRQAALQALARKNVRAALRNALSAEAVAEIAKEFPEAAAKLEQRGSWLGEVEYVIFDDANLRTHRELVLLRRGSQKLEVLFRDGLPPGLECSKTLRVEGVQIGELLVAEAGGVGATTGGTTAAAVTCGPSGNQSTVVLLVHNASAAQPSTSASYYHTMFFGTTGNSVDKFWRAGSYGAANASGAVYGWFRLDADYTNCDQYQQILSAAVRAADSQVNFLNYSRLFIVFPKPATCSWAGLGTIGCTSFSSADGSARSSVAWQIADYMTTNDDGVKLSTHEGGHNLGLGHSSSRDFGAEALGGLGAQGTLSEYGDKHSTMGSWNLGDYSALHKTVIGWFPYSSNVQTVESAGTYAIGDYGITGSDAKALKIRRGTGNDMWLWAQSKGTSGVIIRYQDYAAGSGAKTHLLDFSPGSMSDDFADAPLGVGRTWTDPYSNVSLTVTSATTAGASVQVSYGALPCTKANPTVTISPDNPSVYKSASAQSVVYTVSVKNNDSIGCSNATFAMSSAEPSGWATAFTPGSATVSPGGTGTVQMSKSVPGGQAIGVYPVNATATSGSYTATDTASLTVTAAPESMSVTVTVPKTTYERRETVAATATTSQPAATVAFTAKRSGVTVASATLTADGTNKAVWNYKPNKTGSYTVTATASKAGFITTTSNTVSFTVQ